MSAESSHQSSTRGEHGAQADQARPTAPAPATPPQVIKPALSELFAVAGPTVASMTSYTVMQFTDKWLVSRLGSDPVFVGAQGNGGLAAFVPIAIAMGAITVINTYVSQNMGAGRQDRGPAYMWNGLWFALAFWACLLMPYAFALHYVYEQAGIDPRQASLAVEYGQVLLFGAFLTLGARCVAQFFYGLHKAWIVMFSSIAANIVNVVLGAILMFGDGPPPADFGAFGRVCQQIAITFGIKPMGIAGSAWGTVIATGLELLVPMIVFLSARYNRLYHTRSQWRVSLPHLKDIFRLGWPPGLMFGNEMICWGYFMVFLVSGFGKNHGTAGWIAHQYMSLSFMPAVGLSVACTALVGKYMGMKRPDIAAKRAWLGLKIAMIYMLFCGLCFVAFRKPMIHFFLDSGTKPEDVEQIVKLGSMFLIATAAFQAFDAVAMIMSGSLRGAGDTVVPGIVTLVLSWTIIVGGGTLLVRIMPQWGSVSAWVAAAAYIACLGLFLLWRFSTGRWKSIDLLKRSAGATGH